MNIIISIKKTINNIELKRFEMIDDRNNIIKFDYLVGDSVDKIIQELNLAFENKFSNIETIKIDLSILISAKRINQFCYTV
jgi:hypothetical protein